ncbi:hypothetical protein NPIL_317731 [Nephila pilipes]|uniref:Uncharacterized protein n=1 Tax=Nephila pilipes TaxID=299642 RepID=A0A8X6PPX8_NEPPI|nr:hypothetical protein NPIL_317731 [Nephila pilipes]
MDTRRSCREVHGATALVYLPGRSSSVTRWLRGGVGGAGEGGWGLRYFSVQWESSIQLDLEFITDFVDVAVVTETCVKCDTEVGDFVFPCDMVIEES